MDETYLSEHEYHTYFEDLNGLRSRIAGDMPVLPGMRILDLATGYGYFAIAVAKRDASLRVTGFDIAHSDVRHSRQNYLKYGVGRQAQAVRMDATRMALQTSGFDMVVNFLGLEDIHMTRGRDGVEKTFFEVNRVLKPGHCFCFTVMPPEVMDTPAQQTEVALFSYICDSTWLSLDEYIRMLKGARLQLVDRRVYRTGKRLTPEQARVEIRFACGNVPRIYGKSTPCFEEVWARFGSQIETHGLGQASKVVLVVTQKIGEARG